MNLTECRIRDKGSSPEYIQVAMSAFNLPCPRAGWVRRVCTAEGAVR